MCCIDYNLNDVYQSIDLGCVYTIKYIYIIAAFKICIYIYICAVHDVTISMKYYIFNYTNMYWTRDK